MNKIFDNRYGTTYTFEIVDKIPKGYVVWNINFDHLGDGYVPLCQIEKGTYNVIQSTLKAIKVEDAEERAAIKRGAARGMGSTHKDAKIAREILKKYKEV